VVYDRGDPPLPTPQPTIKGIDTGVNTAEDAGGHIPTNILVGGDVNRNIPPITYFRI